MEYIQAHIGVYKLAGWGKQNEVNAAQSKKKLDAIILN